MLHTYSKITIIKNHKNNNKCCPRYGEIRTLYINGGTATVENCTVRS